jgi:threonine/homoserine/homoserine lactone efflux protein
MGITGYTTFLITSLLFIMSPGIDTIFILNKSIIQGRRSGLIATLGITTGVLVHTTFAAFGLSLILAQSAMAFNIVKYAGAAYLIYLGLSKLISSESLVQQKENTKLTSLRQTFTSAVLTNTLNPKVAIFFLAFFPQFIEPAYLHSAKPFIFLGTTYAMIGLLWFIMLTIFAGSFSHKLNGNPLFRKWLNRFSAIAFILMGVKIAFTKK